MSYSPLSVFMAFVLSVLFVSLAFIERAIHKTPLRSPEQIIVLVMGIAGIIYSAIIAWFKLMPLLGL